MAVDSRLIDREDFVLRTCVWSHTFRKSRKNNDWWILYRSIKMREIIKWKITADLRTIIGAFESVGRQLTSTTLHTVNVMILKLSVVKICWINKNYLLNTSDGIWKVLVLIDDGSNCKVRCHRDFVGNKLYFSSFLPFNDSILNINDRRNRKTAILSLRNANLRDVETLKDLKQIHQWMNTEFGTNTRVYVCLWLHNDR